jgi:long-chain acyl-CoA synthetase
MDAMICGVGTTEGVPDGDEGEICVAGPPVMLGYLNDPQATAQALRRHADGRTWLHTGDLGRRDGDGFFYFTVRVKRMIKSSGFNVYPAQVEKVLAEHPQVSEACVIGVPDERQGERVEAVVVLKSPDEENDATAQALIEFCRQRLIKWSCPREIAFRRSLPQTRVGKVDYRTLVAEHAARQTAERA